MPTAYECSHVERTEKRTEDTIDADTPEAAAVAFKERYGRWPDDIDGRSVAICESCENVMLDGFYASDEDGVPLCLVCVLNLEDAEVRLDSPRARPEPPTT